MKLKRINIITEIMKAIVMMALISKINYLLLTGKSV